MDSIRVENYRSLTDSGWLDLAPLNIIVGRNSAGKSSFLRLFALLKQSVETLTSSPLLWNGRLVDYGSIESVLNQNNLTAPVTISFKLNVPLRGLARRRRLEKPCIVSISLSPSKKRERGTSLSKMKVELIDTTITIQINESGKIESLKVNANEYLHVIGEVNLSTNSHVLPTLTSRKPRQISFIPYTSSRISRTSAFYYSGYNIQDSIDLKILEILDPFFHKNTRKENRLKRVENLNLIEEDTISLKSALLSIDKNSSYWNKSVNKIMSQKDKCRQIRDLLVLKRVPEILFSLDNIIARFSNQVKYLGPFRANPQRYYRFQDLSIQEVDEKGLNLALWLRSLSRTERTAFSNWTHGLFGFNITARMHQEHIVLELKDESGQTRNLSDLGFGYSQLLPVAAHIWSAMNNIGSRTSVLLIEQPELHLHPALQRKVGHTLANAVETIPNSLFSERARMVIETHSECIINEIGYHISEGTINNKDVQVLIFDKNNDKDSCISTANFLEDGRLSNWPYGFFN